MVQINANPARKMGAISSVMLSRNCNNRYQPNHREVRINLSIIVSRTVLDEYNATLSS